MKLNLCQVYNPRMFDNAAYFGCLSDTPKRYAYAKLWDEITPKTPWTSNPWVFRYEFELNANGERE